MTLDELQRRDARIAALEALGRARSPAEQDEFGQLIRGRDAHWRKLPTTIERARRKAADLEIYARQIGLPLEDAA